MLSSPSYYASVYSTLYNLLRQHQASKRHTYSLLELVLRWDANCCVWPHFVPYCALFHIPHQQYISDAMQTSSSLSTHPLINSTSINHSACIFTIVIGDSFTWRICSGWRRATLKSIIRVMCVLCSRWRIQPHRFRDRFSIEMEILLRVTLQWITV